MTDKLRQNLWNRQPFDIDPKTSRGLQHLTKKGDSCPKEIHVQIIGDLVDSEITTMH